MSDNKVNQESKCSNEIYSDLNYEKQREDNLKRTQELYQGIFTEYSQVYSDYIVSQQEAISNPMNADAQNKSDAARVQKKPKIIGLNRKLVDIETELLNNNKTIRESIEKQHSELEKDNKEIKNIDKKINKLEAQLKIMEDKSYTGKYTITDIQHQYHKLTFWYYLFLILSILFFVIFIITFKFVLPS
jgi:hypothetical protein